MINIIKHKEELKPILLRMIGYEDLAMVNGRFCRCGDIKCSECYFYGSDGKCTDNALAWLLSESEEDEDNVTL